MLRRVVPAIFNRRCALSAAAASSSSSCVGTTIPTPLSPHRLISSDVAKKVIAGLKDDGNFSSSFIDSTVEQFMGFNLPESYSAYYNPSQIQEHVRAFMSAKVGNPQYFDFRREVDKYGFYWCEDTFEAQIRTTARMEKFVMKQLAEHPGHGVTVASYSSAPIGGAGDNTGRRNVIFFSVELFPFIDASGKGLDLNHLATREFLTRKRDAAKVRYQGVLDELRTSIAPVFNVSKPLNDGTVVFTVAVSDERLGHLSALVTMLSHVKGAHVVRTFCESFSNKAQVYSLFVRGCTNEDLRRVGTNFGLLPKRPRHPLMALYQQDVIDHEQVIFGHAMMIFCQYFTPPLANDDFVELERALIGDGARLKRLEAMRSASTQELVTDKLVGDILNEHPQFLIDFYADFAAGTTEASAEKLQNLVNKTFMTGSLNHAVMSTCVKFLSAIRRTNFYRVGRAAVSYRLDPAVVLRGMQYPRIPFGIYMVVGADFRGFHIRFHDIARGGVRLIVSANEVLHTKNRRTLFQENYNLAYTQTLKNKDIPESGSKGTILVSLRCPRDTSHYKRNYMQYIDSLLDSMLEAEGVRDTLKQPEILFLGPDENTAGDFPTVAAVYAKSRKYPQWKSLTTGKDPSFGGIPHDIDGMTTRSVRQQVQGIYRKLNLDGSKLVKFITGGPDGDLGSNEIKQGNEQIRGLCDGTASLVDPDNIDLHELRRLAAAHEPLANFDKTKLGPKAVFVLVSEPNQITGPTGETYTNGTDFRNKFHFHPWNTCEVFVPCGGRPGAVTIANVNQFLINAPGVTGEMMLTGHANVSSHQLRFRYIVEGANLFITQDARLALERCGVILIKDSTANKGGVTSSSIEVFTGLALTDAQHTELMCVTDPKNPPQFYSDLKKDIITRVEANARQEFECMWEDVQQGNCDGVRTLISDALSRKIVSMVELINASNLHNDTILFRYVIHEYVPKTLFTQVSLDDIFERVPQAYLRAIFAKSIASNFVYSIGVEANEFAFFDYMRKLLKAAEVWGAGKK